MKSRLSWAVLPAFALVMACSMEEGRSPRNPVAADWPDAEAAASTVSASQLCTQGFWKNHPEAWPEEEITIGEDDLTTEEALVILSTPPRGDATFILAHQLIAAKLNVLSGAEDTVADTIMAADAWLAVNPLGSNPKGPRRKLGIAMAETLDDFNNGAIESVPCDASAPTPEPTPEPELF